MTVSSDSRQSSASAAIRIENALGVCGVREDTRLLAETASRARAGRALDLGTGSGYVAIHLALCGWDVDAVDVSPRALELARHNTGLNGVAPNVFRSNLFEAVSGTYDVIACNPPMRPDETEGSRLITATLRRVGVLANFLVRVTQPVVERKRLDFLKELASCARGHLAPGGRLLLVISPLEEVELPACVPGLVLKASLPVASIPGLNVTTFTFAGGAG
jgi:methylase of polypeptide subunit release factors